MARVVQRKQWLVITGVIVGLCMFASTAYAWNLPQAESIQFKAADSDGNALVFRALFAFIAAGAAAYGLALCIKRFAPNMTGRSVGGDKTLERLETLRLSQRSVLYRVRVGDEELIIGESEGGVALLTKQLRRQGSPEESTNE